MSLLLTGTEDHALLAVVIQEARKAADESGGFVGRTAVQKIMYFLQVGGVPMSYRFSIHHYGPYCEDIVRDIEWLAADGVIKDQSASRRKYSNYGSGPALDELLSLHRDRVEQWRGPVRELVRSLVPLRPERMEEVATLDYIYRQQKAAMGAAPTKESVVSRFVNVKGSKFPRTEVETLYDVMCEAGLLKT